MINAAASRFAVRAPGRPTRDYVARRTPNRVAAERAETQLVANCQDLKPLLKGRLLWPPQAPRSWPRIGAPQSS